MWCNVWIQFLYRESWKVFFVVVNFHLFIFEFLPNDMFFRERKGGVRETEGERTHMDVKEKHKSVASCIRPYQGSNP